MSEANTATYDAHNRRALTSGMAMQAACPTPRLSVHRAYPFIADSAGREGQRRMRRTAGIRAVARMPTCPVGPPDGIRFEYTKGTGNVMISESLHVTARNYHHRTPISLLTMVDRL
jgi:hypothetical protein